METKKLQIEVPESLLKRIEDFIEDEEKFDSESEYLVYAARRTLVEEAGDHYILSDDEKDKIKEKLRSLGYLE